MTNQQRNILVTSALPYANGSIHLGHMVEHIQADIWVRFQKMRGHQCLYICGDDAHGTPIMLSAERQHIKPEQLIKEALQEHLQDFGDFFIEYDNYYTTHSKENHELVMTIYQRLRDQGDIVTRTIYQLFDPEKQMFLPDRFVKGTCPRCNTPDQYGDSCEACGATYAPTELKNPISIISGTTPIEKESEHYFFDLPKYTDMLRHWTQNGHLQEQVTNKLNEWFTIGLQAWDISRDAPYFGFEIPNAPGKYFYVWLDAPVGYMASLQNLCERRKDLTLDAFWNNKSQTELYHFIGKDIIYFHALFWPAMLKGAGFRTPTAIFSHGFLTVDGQKMSKSRGTFIKARTYLNHLNPEYLRYYFAAKLTNRLDDIDLNLSDFTQRVNADLVGKVVNIASRCAGFISKYFDNTLSSDLINETLWNTFNEAGDRIAELYENREFSRAIREIMELADSANQFIDSEKPWTLIKTPGQEKQVHDVCTLGINLFRLLMIYLKPVIPQTAFNTEDFLNISPLQWQEGKKPLLNHRIKVFKPLLQRIEESQINAMKESAKDELQAVTA